jgi:lipopolysaccharide export system protein LptA
MMRIFTRALLVAVAALLSVALVGHAQAQTGKPPSSPPAQRAAQANPGPANALQGFSKNRNEPVQIEAASLEVRDKDKVATFSGNVHVIQGDTDLRSKTLVVFYEGDDAGKGGIKAAQPGPGGSSQIKRLEASGNVLVTQKDQTATGDKGVFDMRSNTITLIGNVVISQGQNVLRGERLVVDRVTGVSRMEGGRVQGIFQRGPQGEGSPGMRLPGTN